MLQDAIYKDETAARKHLEALRWPNGAVCPHCASVGNAAELAGKSTRPGLYKCRACRKPFSVTVGTVFERSKIPLTKWLIAVDLMTASKKGISAHQLHRMLKITYKSAWFMAHRIREAMRPANDTPMGGNGAIIEVDETYVGGKESNRHVSMRRKGGGAINKEAVVSLVQRGGHVRSFHVAKVNSETLADVLSKQIKADSILMTDQARYYTVPAKRFAAHHTVDHSIEEYVRGNVTTNTVEGYFSMFKRGMKGVYQHCSEAHLKRYLCEFDFRYNERAALGVDDSMRACKALMGIGGKRLTYRRIDA